MNRIRSLVWHLVASLLLVMGPVGGPEVFAAKQDLILDHTPILYATPYEDLVVKAKPNRPELLKDLTLFYRGSGKRLFESYPMSRTPSGDYTGVIPAAAMSRKGVVYFIAGRDEANREVLMFSSPDRPHVVVCHSIVLVRSSRMQLYDDVVQGIRREVGTDIKEFDLSSLPEATLVGRLERDPPEILIAVGPRAADAIRRSKVSSKVPVIYSMVPDPSSPDLRGSNSTGISIDISVRQSLETFRTLIPQGKTVGIIFNPARTGALAQEARALAPSFGFEIVTARIEESGEVAPMLRAFEKGIDALWILPDSTVVSGANFSSIVQFSRRNRVPLFVFSQDLVKKGALAALSPDYGALGMQTGRMVRRVLEGTKPANLPPASPDRLQMAVNLRTAQDLKLEGVAQRIVEYAAERELAINVFK